MLRLSRQDKTYRPNEKIRGTLTVDETTAALPHDGIVLTIAAAAHMQLASKHASFFDSHTALKPLPLMHHVAELQPPKPKAGKPASGAAPLEIPFEHKLVPLDGAALHETYHGFFLSVTYTVTVEIAVRGLMAKKIKRALEFFVEAPEPSRALRCEPEPFSLVPESLEKSGRTANKRVPTFRVTGRIDATELDITKPLTGEVVIEECSATIRSLELQLVRVEVVSHSEGQAREATEIQNIQIGDGDVARGDSIPVYMVFPRHFTCPSVSVRSFRIDFELNLVVLFMDGHLLTRNFALKLRRCR